MSLRYEYPDGVLPEEMPALEIFERDVLPFVTKNGSEIGERAVQGYLDAEEIIRRHRLINDGLPHLRPENLRLMIAALKRWQAKRTQ